jgi:hypothetical protein
MSHMSDDFNFAARVRGADFRQSIFRHLQCGNRQHALHIACPTAGGFCSGRSLETNVGPGEETGVCNFLLSMVYKLLWITHMKNESVTLTCLPAEERNWLISSNGSRI